MRFIMAGLCIALLFSNFIAATPRAKKIRYVNKISIKVPEPSDICLSADGTKLFIVSDQGYLYETDLQGKILRKSVVEGTDFEGVYADRDFVYVVDETARRVIKVDTKDLKQVAVYETPYSGARNSGVEAITFNQTTGSFILITEKNPIYIFEYDKGFHKINQRKFTGARDVSAATYHDGYLWLLSDEDRKVFKLDPATFEILETFSIDVVNPEGIAFDKDGKMIICGDDTKTLYFFNKP
ncbi:SdiA-regulated domain-containing protein [Pedobacter sp. ASV28]|uniref:SdiA-regulated domain-containing protein n=1 Tax=Pedobacter sp. ASV28 TaxID=2795123 RepID=UPI0018EB59DD|nr:SdiA-regulated domain-containing protein [Pedobacter sp. ASV28]